ncbi:3-methyl-2-oxobutanoate hydroxymethyltransferase [Kocuria sp. JC486]|uniref:3-methyl-2-oxobutanoate hydroxymethyltransferase n=1 Tax=Kocuria soli TaxID=2485125 RepID=A0A3N3ZRM8_9MICC|nr:MULTISPECIES: 3-methyl-2-oxobutanoate hydroxymethyltransferase [Kocuria]NHU84393.1 3-methyl-2-oxobutanoate hydroxymethyltransferase [Kocuria sp. JC486]ROZ63977.1 3-methyl-2-oxobutanoate hydroxymethyltransferase [Kocuria soli]
MSFTPAVQDPSDPSAKPLPEVRRVRTHHLAQAKATGEKFSMLTSYDHMTAELFDAAGVDMLLVGDSAGGTVLGHTTSLAITVEQMLPMCAAVAAAARRAFVVVDLPFGSYEESPEQAVRTAVRFMKEGGAHGVKIEADESLADHVAAVVRAGIPVIGHVGFTPQSEHAMGGYRIQGRGEAAQKVVDDALALEAAGAFCILLEMVSAETARAVDQALGVPTIGIGAGSATTGQVLVWQDALGLNGNKVARFVKQYADLRSVVSEAVGRYVSEVRNGSFPSEEHTY